MTDLEQTVLALCAVSSPTGDESALCDLVEARCVASVGRLAVARDGNNLVVTPVGARTNAPTVLLAGHLDVVRTRHTGPPRIDGERLYGPGAADMKSGLGVMLHLLDDLAAGHRPVYTPVFVFYDREEGPYADNGLGTVLARFESLSRAQLAVCLEPSSNALQLGCVGSLHARVTFHGRTAHSARPWQGDNAIHKAGGFLQRLAAQAPRDVGIDGMLYREVMSATMAEGGRGRNVVPDSFTLNVNVRFAPGRSSDDALDDVLGVVAGEGTVEAMDRSPSAVPHGDHAVVRALVDAGVRGVEPKQAWTDVGRFAQHGIPAVNLGPGTQSQAHQEDEWTDRGALAEGLKLFRRWMFGTEEG